MILAFLVAAAGVCVSPPPELRQTVTSPPASATCGTPIDVGRFYPPLARKWNIVGLVRLSCRQELDGRVSDCRVDQQDPLNMGFGDAALRMQSLYRVDPGHGVGLREGSRVAFAVPFRLLPPGVEGPSDWLPPARPQGQIQAEVFAKAYPPLAKALGMEGSATISCVNTPAGQLTNCVVDGENPPGQGFGDAALRLVPLHLKAPDQRSSARPFLKRNYRVPIRFRLPK